MTATWPAERVDRLRGFLADGLSYTRAGRRLGCSRNAIAGAVRAYIHLIPDHRPELAEPRLRTDLWTEAKLTESWASWSARRARLRREAAAAKPLC